MILTQKQAEPDRFGRVVVRNRGAYAEALTDESKTQARVQKHPTPKA